MRKRGPKTYRDILLSEFQDRKKSNPGYSLNAFASRLGISASHLSRILRGHYGISREMALKMADLLQLEPALRDFFCDSAEALHARSATVRKAAQTKIEVEAFFPTPVTEAEFLSMSTWIHYALVDYVSIHLDVEEERLRQAFDLPEDQFKKILNEVIAMKFLSRSGTRVLRNFESDFSTSYINPATAEGRAKLKQLHLDLLARATHAQDTFMIDKRFITSGMMTFPSSRRAEADQMLTDFRREFIAKFGAMKDADSTYALTLAFFRLDHN